MIPALGRHPKWPYLDDAGRFRWPEGVDRPTVRKYTVRAINVAEGWLDIDFVLHENAGPGSAWAAAAKPGDVIGLVGPGGRSAGPAGDYLLAGDETALPAIARMLETLPATAQGIALIEIANVSEKQPIDNRTAIKICWLHRSGTTSPLPEAISAIPAPEHGKDIFVWVSCEFAAFKAIRAHIRKTWNLPKQSHLITSYWRRGMSEEAAERREAVANAVAGMGKRLGVAVES